MICNETSGYTHIGSKVISLNGSVSCNMGTREMCVRGLYTYVSHFRQITFAQAIRINLGKLQV